MKDVFVITGTDTNVGKTVFSAALMQALERKKEIPYYWKPVQSGVEDIVDTRMVQKLSGLSQSRFLPEAYMLSEPLSPHRAAEIDRVEIDTDALYIPPHDGGALIIEGAGGLMVPLTRGKLYINQFKRWNVPVILVARASLGTINHTLLSVEALWHRKIPLHGIVFVGEGEMDNIKTIAELTGERILGHLPHIENLTPETLKEAFDLNFDINDFIE